MKTNHKKYRLLEREHNGLYRIEALRDFGKVKAGDIGGYIESEKNLSHDGNAWVYDDAQVYDNAKVSGNAWVCGNARVYGNADVFGNAQLFDNARVYGNAEVYDNADVFGNAKVSGNAWVHGNARVYGNAQVFDSARVYGNAEVYDNAEVVDVAVWGNAQVCGDAKVCSNKDYIVFKNWWSSGRYFTWTRSNNMWKVGCFYGTGEELIQKAHAESEESGREYERVVKYVESINKELEDNNGTRTNIKQQ